MIEVVLACAVCFDPNDRTSEALLRMTIFLSLLPLGMVLGGGWFLYRRVAAHEASLPARPDDYQVATSAPPLSHTSTPVRAPMPETVKV